MDKEQKRKIKKLEEEATDVLGSGTMITVKGQPFLDAQGEKSYLERETLDEEKNAQDEQQKDREEKKSQDEEIK